MNCKVVAMFVVHVNEIVSAATPSASDVIVDILNDTFPNKNIKGLPIYVGGD